MSEDCIDCGDEIQGVCDWDNCVFDADYRIRDVTLVYRGARVFVGDVDVCGGHYRRATRLGRVTVSEMRILRALEAQV